MKKKYFARTSKLIKRTINVRNWADYDRMKGFTAYLFAGIKQLFVPYSAKRKATFDEVQSKMGLTAGDLLERQRALLKLSYAMLGVAIALLGYTFYLLVNGHVAAFFLSLVITMLALSLAFRYHYWQYLIKNKKLNSSIREWYRQGILGEKQ